MSLIFDLHWCRVVIVYRDGFITLWDIRGSKAVFTSGGTVLQSVYHETKKVTAACWACPFGSKLVTGYSNGDIFIWGVPSALNFDKELELCSKQSSPIHKLNLGYKLDKIPIASIKWVSPEGKASRLYVLGSSDYLSANSLQVLLKFDAEMCYSYTLLFINKNSLLLCFLI